MEEIEISSLDLRYEDFRMKVPTVERRMLVSIMEQGIRDPLRGVNKDGVRILLDGFKRYRCALKLFIKTVPYQCIGDDEALGIIDLLRQSNAVSLSIVEQARLIDELKTVHLMSTSEIADLLERSKAWVSVRSGMMSEMSQSVLKNILDGEFPVYAYMHILRPFIRINKISSTDVDEFVAAVSGHGLSVRDIEVLSHGYFKGSEHFRLQIREGNLKWGLNKLKEPAQISRDCSQREQRMLRDLEILFKYMQRVSASATDKRFKSNSFFAQANLLSGGILRLLDTLSELLRQFHDRTRQA
jgi:hypothetical protein